LSHIVNVDCEFRELEGIRAACKRLGWEFREGQTSFQWYGSWVGDTELPPSMLTTDERNRFELMSMAEKREFCTQKFSQCSHAIHVPGVDYEIGIQGYEGAWKPVWDYFDNKLLAAMGNQQGDVLKQAYAIEVAKLEAQANGYPCYERQLANGSVELEVQVY
jgi:hypothetical protein